MDSMKITVVIPAYNEERAISPVIADVQKLYTDIIVVDDGSNDRTAEIAEGRGVTLLRHSINRGQGAALETGKLYALAKGADIIVTFDADGQHDARDIVRMVAPIVEGKADVALGSRFLQREGSVYIPFLRKILLKGVLLHQWIFTGLSLTDAHCGLRAFNRGAAERITIAQDHMSHASEILDKVARYKLPFVEIPITVCYTTYSRMKGQRGFMGSLRVIYDFFIGRFI